jgi:hypothetical protein
VDAVRPEAMAGSTVRRLDTEAEERRTYLTHSPQERLHLPVRRAPWGGGLQEHGAKHDAGAVSNVERHDRDERR